MGYQMFNNKKKAFIREAIDKLKPYFEDCETSEKWLYVHNPQFGGLSPIAMFDLGKGNKVLQFIDSASTSWDL